MRSKLVAVPAALLLLVTLLGSVGHVSAQDTGATFPVTARFLNAMTNMDKINIYLNGADKDQRIIENLAYGTVSDSFELTVPAAEIIVKAPVDFGLDQWLFDTVVPTAAGNEYLIVVSDFMILPTQINDVIPAPGNAAGKVINAAAQSPSLDVLLNDETVITDLKYGRSSITGERAAGTYHVKLNATGTTTTAFEADVDAADGSSNIWVIIGTPGSTETPLTVVSIAGVPAETAAAASPEATPAG